VILALPFAAMFAAIVWIVPRLSKKRQRFYRFFSDTTGPAARLIHFQACRIIVLSAGSSLMLEPVAVYEMLAHDPFQPVRVVLKNNLSYDIRSREMIVVGVDFLAIGFQAEGRAKGICGSQIRVPLKEVLRVEPIIATVPPSSSS
jgi:hypothetical protein